MSDMAAIDSMSVPVFIDLDGTLINTDLPFESFFALLRKRLCTACWYRSTVRRATANSSRFNCRQTLRAP